MQTRELAMDCDTGGQYALIDQFANDGLQHHEQPPAESPIWKTYDPAAKPKALVSDQVVVRARVPARTAQALLRWTERSVWRVY